MKLRSRAREQITLVATGGYGRDELNPHSDIDLMFLYGGKEGRLVEDIAQKILYFLWDMRLDVGYSVRTVNDCIEIAGSDTTVKTALLDIRHVCGNRPLYKELMKIVLTRIMTNGSDAFIRQKVADLNTRREKYGSSVYLLEPNTKEGEGGLRDLQTALWIAKVRFKVTDPRELLAKGVVSEEELKDSRVASSRIPTGRPDNRRYRYRRNRVSSASALCTSIRAGSGIGPPGAS